MKNLLAVQAVLVALTATALAADDQDLPKFQGSWVITGLTAKGKALPLQPGKKVTLTFDKDGKVVSEGGDQGKQEGTFKIDSTRKPKYIDIVNDKESITGIYTIDGDTLTMAVALSSKQEVDDKTARPRPVAFEGDNVLTITLTKEKAK
jgi:uncharacterized protein (TIGR03067 family)